MNVQQEELTVKSLHRQLKVTTGSSTYYVITEGEGGFLVNAYA